MAEAALPKPELVPPIPADGRVEWEETFDAALRARGTQQSLLVEVNSMLAAAADVEAVLGPALSRLVERARLVNATIHLFGR